MTGLGFRRVTKFAVAFTLSICAGMSNAFAAPFENAIADDCILLINIADTKALKEKMSATHMAQLCNDPDLQPFVNGLVTELKKTFTELEADTGVNFDKLLSLPQGQVVLAAGLKPGWPIPYVQLLAEVGEHKQEAQELLDLLTTKLEEKGIEKRTAGEMTVFTSPKQPQAEFAFTIQGSILALGVDPSALQGTLDRIAKPAGSSVVETKHFRNFRERSQGNGDFELFVNVSRIVPLVSAAAGFQAQNIMQTFGLDRFEFIGVSSSVGQGDFDFQSHSMVVTQGQTPVFNLLNMPAKPTTPQAWVPSNVASYSTFHWDLDLFYNTLSGILDGFLPGAMQQAELMVSQFPTPDNPFIASIKGDVIGPLGNRLTTVGDIGETDGMPVGRTLIAWELDDADKMKDLVTNLMLLVGPLLETKTVKGSTVYMYDAGAMLRQLPNQNAAIPVGVVGFTIANSQMYLTTHIELLDAVMNFTGAGLSESPEYRKIASHYPANISGSSYTRGEVQAEMVWRTLKSGQISTMLRAAMAGQDDDDAARYFDGWITALDGSNLPEFDTIKEHFSVSGGYSVMDENGLSGMTFQLK